MSMFSRRPDKSIFSGLSDAPEETIHASAPQSVSIEKCVRTRFCIPSKISQLTVLNCEDVEIEFLGVISSVELIRCVRCVLKCMQSCATYTLDDSDSCTLQFPGRQERVMVVSTHSSGRTVLLAQPGQAALPPVSHDSEEKEPADISTEIRYVIEPDSEMHLEESAAPTPSGAESDSKQPDLGEEHHRVPGATFTPAATKQYKTTWTNGAFSTHTLVSSTHKADSDLLSVGLSCNAHSLCLPLLLFCLALGSPRTFGLFQCHCLSAALKPADRDHGKHWLHSCLASHRYNRCPFSSALVERLGWIVWG